MYIGSAMFVFYFYQIKMDSLRKGPKEKKFMALKFLWTFPYDAIKYTFYTYYDGLKISVVRN